MAPHHIVRRHHCRRLPPKSITIHHARCNYRGNGSRWPCLVPNSTALAYCGDQPEAQGGPNHGPRPSGRSQRVCRGHRAFLASALRHEKQQHSGGNVRPRAWSGHTNLLLACLPLEQRPPLSAHSQYAWSEPSLPKAKNSTTPCLQQPPTLAAPTLAENFLPLFPLPRCPDLDSLGPWSVSRAQSSPLPTIWPPTRGGPDQKPE